jgi:hypothetical protein|mmetsp:Transcript_38010/g.63152  ORF Transcript_38010/g.63152 Transcript_38010/m.63152 type:complete len:124 (-) Transcript_38010:795-1166(-)
MDSLAFNLFAGTMFSLRWQMLLCVGCATFAAEGAIPSPDNRFRLRHFMGDPEPLSGGDAVNADLDAELVLPEELHLPLLSRPTRQAGFGGALGAGFLVGQEAEGLKDNGILAAEFPMSPGRDG